MVGIIDFSNYLHLLFTENYTTIHFSITSPPMCNFSGFSGLFTWFHNVSMILDNHDNPKNTFASQIIARLFHFVSHVLITNGHMQYFHLDYKLR